MIINTYVPFCGFYFSPLSGDSEIEQEQDYIAEELGIEQDKHGYIDIFVSYDYDQVGKDYTSWFKTKLEDIIKRDYSEEVDLDSMEFETIISPKYYNFETDRCYVNLDEEAWLKLWNVIDKKDFDTWLRERMRPRDGFFPHYSNFLDNWDEDSLNWEAPQYYLVLEYLCRNEDNLCAEYYCDDGYEAVRYAMELRCDDDIIDELVENHSHYFEDIEEFQKLESNREKWFYIRDNWDDVVEE